jgi:hypothetical protein
VTFDLPLAAFLMFTFAVVGALGAFANSRMNHEPFDWWPILYVPVFGALLLGALAGLRYLAWHYTIPVLIACAAIFIVSARYRGLLAGALLHKVLWLAAVLLFLLAVAMCSHSS